METTDVKTHRAAIETQIEWTEAEIVGMDDPVTATRGGGKGHYFKTISAAIQYRDQLKEELAALPTNDDL